MIQTEKLFSNGDQEIRAKYLRLISLLLISLPIFVLGVFPDQVNPYLEYQREQVSFGQLWRLLSCNFVHLSSNHMFMNLSVYVLLVLVFGSSISIAVWHVSLVVCCVTVGFGMFIFDPSVVGYVGLSGAIYGMMAFGLLANIKQNPYVYFLVYAFITYKVITQQSADFDPKAMADFIGGNVIASAHLMGLVAGNFCAAVLFTFRLKSSKYKHGESLG